MTIDIIPLPDVDTAEVVVPAPAPGPGNWAGAASATLVDGHVWLTYRVRRPIDQGRGVSTVVARSADGVRFETVSEVWRKDFGAESFERPVVLRRPDGGWRLYVSCATPGTKHWWIEAIDADTPEGFPTGVRTIVAAGDDEVAVKDPVIVVEDGLWHMWTTEHPLADVGHEDRMRTAYSTSDDGLAWTRRCTALVPREGAWDSRGARVTAVLSLHPLTVLYDGRSRAEDNWHEVTGVARGDGTGLLVADPDGPLLRSPHSDGALRYAAAVPLGDGRTRFYFEAARPDGAHDLVTSVSPR